MEHVHLNLLWQRFYRCGYLRLSRWGDYPALFGWILSAISVLLRERQRKTASEGKRRCDDGGREQFEAGFECGGRSLRQGMWFQNMEEQRMDSLRCSWVALPTPWFHPGNTDIGLLVSINVRGSKGSKNTWRWYKSQSRKKWSLVQRKSPTSRG